MLANHPHLNSWIEMYKILLLLLLLFLLVGLYTLTSLLTYSEGYLQIVDCSFFRILFLVSNPDRSQ